MSEGDDEDNWVYEDRYMRERAGMSHFEEHVLELFSDRIQELLAKAGGWSYTTVKTFVTRQRLIDAGMAPREADFVENTFADAGFPIHESEVRPYQGKMEFTREEWREFGPRNPDAPDDEPDEDFPDRQWTTEWSDMESL